MSDDLEIRHCGRGDRGLLPANERQATRESMIRFRFECPMQWELLEATDDPNVRRCGECQQPVYRCPTIEAAEALARAGECIAVDRRLAGQAKADATPLVVGRPDPLEFWARRIFGER